MGEKLLERYIDRFDAVEGFNAQAIFQSFLTRLPFVGKPFSPELEEIQMKKQNKLRRSMASPMSQLQMRIE